MECTTYGCVGNKVADANEISSVGIDERLEP